MKSLLVLITLVLLGATSLDARAQSSQSTPTTDEVGHTGTDTATTGQAIPTDEDEVGHTGTDTATTGSTPPTDNVGHTGTDTRVPGGPSPWTLSAKSSAISSPGSNTVTVTLVADEAGEDTSYTVPLSASAPCTAPASIVLDWTASAGGAASFQVDCGKVSRRTTVTVTGGTASTSFTLKP